jgi:predicted adenine nucleotide alpha hydrolase (AANH) superfamily ATPase
LLVHICCSVDSHYFLQRLTQEFPEEKLVCFFYDPNIHPYSEYRLRYLDVQYSCEKLGIELLEGEYDLQKWLHLTKGLENEPEKGDRCTVCFDDRLQTSVQKAKELGHTSFTTTLLISPKKSQEKLDKIGNQLAKEYDCKFIFKDYRSGKGIHEQAQEVKSNNLYRQNYCGCLYALADQREQQGVFLTELMSPIGQQILPGSIEQRLDTYKYRDESSTIIKQRILNYRLLYAKVTLDKKVMPSYFLCYSTLKKGKTQGRVENIANNIAYLNRDEVKIITLEQFNNLANTHYKDINEMIYTPISFEKEQSIRVQITQNLYDLSVIIVLDKIPQGKISIECQSEIFEDLQSKLL